jgi:hypothetical protein
MKIRSAAGLVRGVGAQGFRKPARDLLHRRLGAIEAVDRSREVQRLLNRPDPIVIAGREHGRRIADGDPADGYDAAELRRTAPSKTMHSRPMTIEPLSAMTCAPNMIRHPRPTVTSPHNTAFGATNAVGSTLGEAPACVISISVSGKRCPEHKPKRRARQPSPGRWALRPAARSASGTCLDNHDSKPPVVAESESTHGIPELVSEVYERSSASQKTSRQIPRRS